MKNGVEEDTENGLIQLDESKMEIPVSYSSRDTQLQLDDQPPHYGEQSADLLEQMYSDLISIQVTGIFRLVATQRSNPDEKYGHISFEFASDRFCEILGIKRSDLFGKEGGRNLFNLLEAKDLDQFLVTYRSAVQNGSNLLWEGEINRNGTLRWVRFEARSRKLSAGVYRWTGMVVDITHQKIAEKRYANFSSRLSDISDCLASLSTDSQENLNRLTALLGRLLNADGVIFFHLDQDRLTPWSHHGPVAADLIDQFGGSNLCFPILNSSCDEPLVLQNVSQQPLEGVPGYCFDQSLQTYCGISIKVDGNTVGSVCLLFKRHFTLSQDDKRFLGIISTAIGNEDHRLIHQQTLKKNEEKLRELNATKDKFFSIIAHDLKGPFNGIIGFSTILKEEAPNLDDETIIDYAEMINFSAHQTHRLLENLLNWAKIQQGKIQFNPVRLNLTSVIKEVLKLYNDIAVRKKITLINRVQPTVTIMADPDMLATILRNLTSNALKFTKSDGSVIISSKFKGNGLEISVEDSGCGIPEGEIAKLFDPGRSFTTRGTENEKGTGLGLMLCREFIERHKGNISAVNNPDRGVKISFWLPN